MLKSIIGWAIRGLVTFGILYYLVSNVDLDSLFEIIKNANPYFFLYALIAYGVTQLLLSIRWYILLGALGIDMSLFRLLYITLIGQFFNAFLLGSTGGDVSKLIYCIKDQPKKKSSALISILFDRFLGLIVLLFLAVLGGFYMWEQWAGNPEITRIFSLITVLFFGLIGTCVSVIYFPVKMIPQLALNVWERLPMHESAQRFLINLRSLRYQMKAIGKALLVVLLTEVFVVLLGHFSALSIGLDVTLSQTAVVMSMVLCAIALPISISGHGVREGAFVYMYIAFGVIDKGSETGTSMALAVSFLFLAATLFWSLIGGVCFLVGPKIKS